MTRDTKKTKLIEVMGPVLTRENSPYRSKKNKPTPTDDGEKWEAELDQKLWNIPGYMNAKEWIKSFIRSTIAHAKEEGIGEGRKEGEMARKELVESVNKLVAHAKREEREKLIKDLKQLEDVCSMTCWYTHKDKNINPHVSIWLASLSEDGGGA